jgi:hypothetical protein
VLRFKITILAALLSGGLTQLGAQPADLDLKVFGYFQVSYGYEEDLDRQQYIKSFNLQQLNLFLQKELAQNWTALVNLEFVNSYSSFRNWGALNLEEAWVSYRRSDQFKLKLGLQVPVFNNLNEIKNKTPLLPYVIRPLAYETSYNEIIALEEFVPGRAFMQVYGFIPAKELKLDYAWYIGNSPNINTNPRRGQTGVDTTNLFLVGGRFGLRSRNFKLGASITSDDVDLRETALFFGYPSSSFNKVRRLRLGADFSFEAGKWFGASELIRVTYDDDQPQLDGNKEFYYGTLGFHFIERLFVYGGYWVTRQNALPAQEQDILALTPGLTYNFNETIFIKAQYGRVHFEGFTTRPPDFTRRIPIDMNANYYFLAISAVF